jgi:hypothetical protein
LLAVKANFPSSGCTPIALVLANNIGVLMPFSGAGITLQPESWPEGAKALAPMSKPSLHSCNSGEVNGPPFERDFQGLCRAIGMSQERTVKQDVRV